MIDALPDDQRALAELFVRTPRLVGNKALESATDPDDRKQMVESALQWARASDCELNSCLMTLCGTLRKTPRDVIDTVLIKAVA